MTTEADFGDPVNGTTSVALCLYGDDQTLIRGLVVEKAGQLCGSKPCWTAKRTNGFVYKDKAAASDGIARLGYFAGEIGKGRAYAVGANDAAKGEVALPTGVAAALAGNIHPTIQLTTSDGLCIEATMNKTTRDDGVQYKARKR